MHVRIQLIPSERRLATHSLSSILLLTRWSPLKPSRRHVRFWAGSVRRWTIYIHTYL